MQILNSPQIMVNAKVATVPNAMAPQIGANSQVEALGAPSMPMHYFTGDHRRTFLLKNNILMFNQIFPPTKYSSDC
jgi:hypothetical protein